MGTDKMENKVRGLYKRGRVWWINYQVNGKRYFERVSPDKRTAENVLHQRRTAIIENRFYDIKKTPKIKFEDFAKQYIEGYAKLSKKSWISDTYYINTLSKFFAGRYLFEITPKLIEECKSARLKEVSTSSITKELSCLSMIFRKAIDWGFSEENPLRKVKYFKQKNYRTRYLEIEQIEALISKCKPNLRGLVILAIHTGMRRGELFNLQWKDINIRQGYITLLNTKNGKRREVFLNDVAKETLIRLPKSEKSDYVFHKANGEPYKDIRKSFKSALKEAGIKEFVFHCLRHTYATQLRMLGWDLSTIGELLGHQDTRTTSRYAHFRPSDGTKAVNSLSAALKRYKNVTMDTSAVPSRELETPQLVTNR